MMRSMPLKLSCHGGSHGTSWHGGNSRERLRKLRYKRKHAQNTERKRPRNIIE